jgi:hypothetical protein
MVNCSLRFASACFTATNKSQLHQARIVNCAHYYEFWCQRFYETKIDGCEIPVFFKKYVMVGHVNPSTIFHVNALSEVLAVDRIAKESLAVE